jgi:hypothetical protein
MMDIVAITGAAMAVIGFLSVWIKMGVEKGEHKKTMELLGQKTDKHEADIAELKNTTHTIQLDRARTIGRIEAKLDSIGEKVASLKGDAMPRRSKTELQDKIVYMYINRGKRQQDIADVLNAQGYQISKG